MRLFGVAAPEILKRIGVLAWVFIILYPVTLYAAGFEDIEHQIREHVLPNGMKFIILERHDAPVFSGHIYVNVGSSDEIVGNTGISHVFEHMAFKGTTTLGTVDYKVEKSIMDKLDRVFDDLRVEWAKGNRANAERLKELETDFNALESEVAQIFRWRGIFKDPRTGGRRWCECGYIC